MHRHWRCDVMCNGSIVAHVWPCLSFSHIKSDTSAVASHSFQISILDQESIETTSSDGFLIFEIYQIKARFIRRTSHVPNTLQTIGNEAFQLIIYCL